MGLKLNPAIMTPQGAQKNLERRACGAKDFGFGYFDRSKAG
jgi:hypothetical protein